MARGRTESPLRLGARRERAKTLFARGYTIAEVAADLRVSADTAARYKRAYDDEIRAQTAANPALLRDVVTNTVRALDELERVRAAAWERAERTDSDAIRAQMLNIVLKAQDQRAKLFGLFGVKAEFFLQVALVRDQQDRLMQFMREHLCPADRIKLEEYIVSEFAADLAEMPTADIEA